MKQEVINLVFGVLYGLLTFTAGMIGMYPGFCTKRDDNVWYTQIYGSSQQSRARLGEKKLNKRGGPPTT